MLLCFQNFNFSTTSKTMELSYTITPYPQKLKRFAVRKHLKAIMIHQTLWIVCLYVCLFVQCFTSHSETFHSYGDFTIACVGLQILTYARHLWPLSSEGSLASHIPPWHGVSVYNGHFRGPVTLTPIAERLAVELSLQPNSNLTSASKL